MKTRIYAAPAVKGLILLLGQEPGVVCKAACLHGDSTLRLVFKFHKMFLHCTLVKIQYCGKTPSPKFGHII